MTKAAMSIGVAGLPDQKIDTDQKRIEASFTACRLVGEFMTRDRRSQQASDKGILCLSMFLF